MDGRTESGIIYEKAVVFSAIVFNSGVQEDAEDQWEGLAALVKDK